MAKIILIPNGSRSEYRILSPIMDCINSSAELLLQIVVTGAHLSDLYGNSASEIKKDAFSYYTLKGCWRLRQATAS